MTVIGSLFTLPQQYFQDASLLGDAATPSAAVKQGGDNEEEQAVVAAAGPSSSRPRTDKWRESGATCLTCGIGTTLPEFTSSEEQRLHFKSDWHRFNVKRRLANQPPLGEEQFHEVLEQDTEVSISGSESSSEEEEAREGPALQGQQLAASVPRITFKSADGQAFAVWRCLLCQDHTKAADQGLGERGLLQELRRLRAACGMWTVVLLRGGHFAATVFKGREGKASNVAKHDSAGLEGFDVLAHKTFHRYVVRAKAGGKQSSKDATGKFARSAGSRLRRYNETALERDIQELLQSWSGHIASSDLVFVHAPSSNSKTLFSEQQTVLLPSNPRVRRVPFMTHRPTYSETRRVLRLLASVFKPEAAAELLEQQQSTHLLEDEAAAAVAAVALADTDASGHAAAGAALPPVKEEAQKAVNADGAANAEHDEAGGPGPESAAAAAAAPQDTPLHKASRTGNAERVKQLLEAGHDPCTRDAKGRTPYAQAADKATRDAFRRFMAQYPDRWDYADAGVPSPLTDDMEAAQQAKKADKKAKLKAKDADRKAGAEDRRKAAEEATRAAADDEIARAAAEAAAISARLLASQTKGTAKTSSGASTSAGSGPGGKKVGGAAAGSGTKAGVGRGGAAAVAAQQQQPAQLSPEEAARRRDQLAAAAEARMKALTQAASQQKLW